MDPLMDMLRDIDREISPPDQDSAISFLVGMRKMAEGEVPPDVAEAMDPGAEAPADVAGVMEGQFLAPVEQVVTTMAHLVGHELKMAIEYLFYAQMVRGEGRAELAELFKRFAKDELKDAGYLMRRISVLAPGGVQLPPMPTPVPTSDRYEILEQMIAGEQQALISLKALHGMVGDNPMKYTIEAMCSDEQAHLDKLQQFMPSTPQDMEVAKLSAAIKLAHRRKRANMEGAPEEILAQEQQLALAQAAQEREFLASRVMNAEQVASQATMQAQQLQEQLAQEQATHQQTQAAAEQAQFQAAQAQEQVMVAEQNAAQQAEGKMRMALRIQQLRQNLANLAAADPVEEEGLGFGQQAGPGITPMQAQPPQTMVQQQEQAAQEQAAMEAQQQAEMEQVNPKAARETEQARRAQRKAEQAQEEANIQGVQAQATQEQAAQQEQQVPLGGVPAPAQGQKQASLSQFIMNLKRQGY